MRELGGQHALDGDDSGVDAVPVQARDAGRARYEVVSDAAARMASAVEYRQRVEAAYAAYDAADARPREAGVNQGTPERMTGPATGTAGRDDPGSSHHRDRGDPAGRAQRPAGDEHAGYVRRRPAAQAYGDEIGQGQGKDGRLGAGHWAGDAKPGRGHQGEAATRADRGERLAHPTADGAPGNSGTARPGRRPEALVGERPGTAPLACDNGGSGAGEAERTVHADRDTSRRPPPSPDAPGNAAPSREAEDSWPPPRADQDRVRKAIQRVPRRHGQRQPPKRPRPGD
jgi:hypothetical protein